MSNEGIESVLARIDERLQSIEGSMRELKDELRSDFVRRVEFEPVRNAVDGIVALIVTSVIGALVALVLR